MLSNQEIDRMRTKSFEARELSYSPYSKFRVGCAILCEDGEIFTGANIENASYGACICAERTAIAQAVMNGCKKFKAFFISSDMQEFISPCGICRQFIREFSKDVAIYMLSADGSYKMMTLAELLPASFGPEQLM